MVRDERFYWNRLDRLDDLKSESTIKLIKPVSIGLVVIYIITCFACDYVHVNLNYLNHTLLYSFERLFFKNLGILYLNKIRNVNFDIPKLKTEGSPYKFSTIFHSFSPVRPTGLSWVREKKGKIETQLNLFYSKTKTTDRKCTR